MPDVNEPTLQTPTDAIALPPLKMILVHGSDLPPHSAQAHRRERINSRTLKKLIAHLEETKSSPTNADQS